MQESGDDKFLIDRFPRSEDNRAAFKYTTGIEPEFILYYDCSEEEKEKRILGRNQGRADDNIVMLRTRFKVFKEDSLPAVEYYESMGKVHKVDAGNPIDEVFEEFEAIFSS